MMCCYLNVHFQGQRVKSKGPAPGMRSDVTAAWYKVTTRTRQAANRSVTLPYTPLCSHYWRHFAKINEDTSLSIVLEN